MGSFAFIAPHQPGLNMDKSLVEQEHRLHRVLEDWACLEASWELLITIALSKVNPLQTLSDSDRPMWEFAVPVSNSIPACRHMHKKNMLTQTRCLWFEALHGKPDVKSNKNLESCPSAHEPIALIRLCCCGSNPYCCSVLCASSKSFPIYDKRRKPGSSPAFSCACNLLSFGSALLIEMLNLHDGLHWWKVFVKP